MRFACLQGRSAYQLGESCLMPDGYARRAKALGYESIAIADKNSMTALPKLFEACRREGLHPVAGVEMRLDRDSGTYPCFLYIASEEGYRNICYLMSLKRSGLRKEDLEGHTEGLILVIPQNSLADESRDALTLAAFSKLFPHLYIGIQIREKEDELKAEEIRSFASSHGYPALAFPRVCYTGKRGKFILNIVQADRQRRQLTPEEMSEKGQEGPDFLLSPKVLEKLYSAEEISNAAALASSCNFDLIGVQRGHLFSFMGAANKDDAELRRRVDESLEDRNLLNNKTYIDRAEMELKTISDMGYSSYFLIVSDYVEQARARGIEVGPGRGSACGSLVSFLCGITRIDPVKYGISFERFLNPKRVTMPDIDVDFQDDRRDEIVTYLKSKYGELKVSQIVQYQTYAAKSSLQAVARAIGMPDARIRGMTSKLAADRKKVSLADQIEEGRLSSIVHDPYYSLAIECALHLEGLPVTPSIHPSGVIVSDSDLYLSCPMSEGRTGVAQYEHGDLERMGFLKFDLLSLRYLTLILAMENYLRERTITIPDYEEQRDDPETYETICDLRLLGIFQLEGGGFRKAVAQVAPTRFDDLVALVALYRPGPMANIPVYAERKRTGRIPSTGYPILDDILKDTYGIIIYQDQILSIVHRVAGLDMGEADLLRRTISRKDERAMASYRREFIDGCLKNGVSERDAQGIYDLIERFADYGYNKSHSVAYASITFRMAHLKTHYPEAYYTGISRDISPASDSFKAMVNEMASFGIGLTCPDVNLSGKDSRIESRRFIMGLAGVKTIGPRLATTIVEARGDTPFSSLADFLLRLGRVTDLDSRTIAGIADSGALDSLGAPRNLIRERADELAEFASMGIDESMMPDMTGDKPDRRELNRMFVRELDACGVSLRIPLDEGKNSGKKGLQTGIVTQVGNSVDTPWIEIASRYGRIRVNVPRGTSVDIYDTVRVKLWRPSRDSRRWSASQIEVIHPDKEGEDNG